MQQFVSVFDNLVPGWLALTLAVVLVVISQIKINVTNAYSGSLAWTSAWTRTTNAIRDGLFLWWSTWRLPWR
ncbi:transmembrane protein [Klebsiella pneumoniae]|uniref:Transmembrane protein n=1 Tax=Klebsiella pneumoniae TaxID=573 RepID=A0A2X3CH81_KLEPN|nr:transmembrane protein [Klebsiella pneumoniae]